jgi:hypothetical protein
MEPRMRGPRPCASSGFSLYKGLKLVLVISCLIPVIGIRGRGLALNLAKGRRRDP